mgnify:FL=1
MRHKLNMGVFCDRALSKFAQHIGVNQNIFFGLIGYDKTKPFNAIKPLYVARLFFNILVVVAHTHTHP